MFMFSFAGVAFIGVKEEDTPWRVINWAALYLFIIIGIFLFYITYFSQKDVFDEFRESLYTLRYRPPGEVIGNAFRVDPLMEKDVSGIGIWFARTGRVAIPLAGLIVSVLMAVLAVTRWLADPSIPAGIALILFVSASAFFGYRIVVFVRRGPSPVEANFVASEKILVAIQKALSEKHRLAPSTPLTTLFASEILPGLPSVEFRDERKRTGVLIKNLELVRDSHGRNKHMVGRMMLFRSVFDNRDELRRVMEDIKACFPEKRREQEVLLY